MFGICIGGLLYFRYLSPKVDEKIWELTEDLTHLQLDLVSEESQYATTKIGSLMERVSFPHMSATSVAWASVLVAKSVSSEVPEMLVYYLAPTAYLITMVTAMIVKPRFSKTSLGRAAIILAKLIGMVFAGLTILWASLYLFAYLLSNIVAIVLLAILALALIPKVFIGFVEWLAKAFTGTTKSFQELNPHGSARFANKRDLAEAGMLANSSLMLGKYSSSPIYWPQEGHALTVAPTRSGKGISVVIPTLLTYEGAMLVIDPKGENYSVTARARERLGQEAFHIDPFEVVGKRSHSFNPLSLLDPNSPEIGDEAKTIADALVMTTLGEKDPHWNEKAVTAIRTLILYVKCHMPAKHQNLIQVHRLASDQNAFFYHLENEMRSSTEAFGMISRGANEILSINPTERGSIFSTIHRHLDFLNSPLMNRCLINTDFDMCRLKRDEDLTVYLILPAEKMKIYARLLRLWLNTAFSSILKVKDAPRRKVLFMLDEMARLGKMESIEAGVGEAAGHGVALWMILQDLGQLKGLYPESWTTFLANAETQQYFGARDFHTLEYLSKLVGQATIDFKTTNIGENYGSSTGNSNSINGGSSTTGQNTGSSNGTNYSQIGRPLLMPDEIRTLPKDQILIFKQNTPTILAQRLNYLQMPQFQGLYDKNPMHR